MKYYNFFSINPLVFKILHHVQALYFTCSRVFISLTADTFMKEQLKYPRVREAYEAKEGSFLSLLKDIGIES